jgi:hypothetical protein
MAISDSFQNLVNDLSEQVLEQVQGQLQTAISLAINQRLKDLLSDDNIKAIVGARVQENLTKFTPDTSQFEKSLQDVGTNIINRLNDTADQKIASIISDRISSIDINNIAEQFIISKLDSSIEQFPFKAGSIAGYAVDGTTLKITGDQITGGVIRNFASTGIEDQSTRCQITILDVGAVFENTLYAGNIEVKGGAVVDGDLTILGRITNNPAYQQLVEDTSASVQTQIGPNILDQYQDRVFERILNEGMDLNTIKVNGQTIVQGDRLVGVINSQLRTVGTLQDLQTAGETLLSETLYTSARRVGINTLEPNKALSVWDEEIEIGIGKQSKDVAELGTTRAHSLILSSNQKNNITLLPDGTTTIPKARIGNMLFSSSPTPPHYDSVRGTVVFNEQPTLGGPLGWVSLGDAKWANFGIID